MSEKALLLAGADAEFVKLKEAFAGLSEAEMILVWCGSWSARDIAAHISGWHREMIPVLERIARGEKPIPDGVSYEDVDAWNDKLAAAKKFWATADIFSEMDASHAEFKRAATVVPDDRLAPGKTAHKIVDLNSRHHYRVHRDDIAAWRTSKGI
jgi:hypothetical protein